MPNIRTFESPNLGLQPSETGVEATAQAGRLIGRFYNQAAAATEKVGNTTASVGTDLARGIAGDVKAAGDVAVQYAEHQEISHGAAAFAQLNDNLTQAWNKTAQTADPNDPTVAQKFRESVLEPALEKYRDGFLTEGGQKFAEARVDALRNHMFEKTAADMSSLAAVAVEKNLRTSANSMSNTAMSDPSSVPHLLDNVDASVGAMVSSSPNLKGAAAAKARMEVSEKMKEAIVKAGAFGAISNARDPEAMAAKWASDYPNYINGQEEMQLARAAKTQARTNLALQKQTQLYQKQLDELQTHKAANDAFTKNVSIDQTTGRPIVSPQYFKDALDIAKNNPNAPNAATVAKTMIDWGESQQRTHNEVIQTDPTTQKALLDRVFDANNPTSTIDVLRAEADHKLSSHDGTVLRQLVEQTQTVKGPVYQTAIDAVKERLGVSTLVDGHERYANFMSQFWPEYLRQKAAGTLPPDALDLKDPNSLISKAVKAYEPTPQQRLQAHMMKTIGGAMPMNLTGEGQSVTGISVENAPVKLPALSDRKANTVYPTPSGPKRWTGTGWVNP